MTPKTAKDFTRWMAPRLLETLEGEEIRLFVTSPGAHKEFGGQEPYNGVIAVKGGHLMFDGTDHGRISSALAMSLFRDAFYGQFGYLPGSQRAVRELDAEFGTKGV